MYFKHLMCATALGFASIIGGPAVATQPAPGPANAASAKDPLTRARDDLRISELTLKRIERNLALLRAAGETDPSVLADYARYLKAVRGMTERQRKVVREMEAQRGGPTPATPVDPDLAWPEVKPLLFTPPPPVVDDELKRLERELADSLQRFDEYLLREQHEATRRLERIDAASSAEMTGLAQEAAAAVERLREKGIKVDTGGAGGASGQPGEPGEPGEQGPPGEMPPGQGAGQGEGDGDGEGQGAGEGELPGEGSEGGEGGASEAPSGAESGGGASGAGSGNDPASGGSGGGASDPSTMPPSGDRPPANDDDIVARQLREAAERETDPVLKEKLWQEYDRYKGNA